MSVLRQNPLYRGGLIPNEHRREAALAQGGEEMALGMPARVCQGF